MKIMSHSISTTKTIINNSRERLVHHVEYQSACAEYQLHQQPLQSMPLLSCASSQQHNSQAFKRQNNYIARKKNSKKVTTDGKKEA